MSNKSAAKIHLRSYDDLFGVGKPTGSDSDQVVEVLLTDLLPFKKPSVSSDGRREDGGAGGKRPEIRRIDTGDCPPVSGPGI